MQQEIDVNKLTQIQKELLASRNLAKQVNLKILLIKSIRLFSGIGILVFAVTLVFSVLSKSSFMLFISAVLSINIPLWVFATNVLHKLMFYPCQIKPRSLDSGILNYVTLSFFRRFKIFSAGFSKKDCIKFINLLVQETYVKDAIQRLAIDANSLSNVLSKYVENYFNEKEADCLYLLSTALYIAQEEVIRTNSLWITPAFEFLGILSALDVFDELATFNVYYDDVRMYAVLVNLQLYKQEKLKGIFGILNIRPTGLLDSWFTGFTYYLSQFTRDLTQELIESSKVISFYKVQVINQLVQVLLKPSNPYALLVGDPGVGKTSSVYALAQLLLEKQLPEPLGSKRILQIDVNKFLSSLSNYSNPAVFIKHLEQELKQGADVILFIDELERILEDSNYHGLLLGLFPLLERYKVPLIGNVNTQFFNILKKTNPNLLAYFDVIQVPEADSTETYSILLSQLHDMERKYNIFIQLPALRVLIDLVHKYLPAERLPKSAVNIFEKVCVYAATTSNRVVDIKAVHAVLENIIGSKIAVDSKSFATKIITLEEEIHKKYINQAEAVKAISGALVRNFAQLSDKKKPIGTFLFLGTTGVGKTYLAKVVSSILFGENYQIIRVDLGQYKLVSDIPVVLELLSKIRLAPASLVLLDEFEKANVQLHDIFLRLFDEGVLQDPHTQENLYFNNALIVATSNIGSHAILEYLGSIKTEEQAEENFKQVKQLVLDELFNTFKPELLNRFDSIIVFKPLSKANLKKITELKLKQLEQELLNQGIKLRYNPDLLNYIVDKAYNPALGARPINRFVEQVIKSAIASYIVNYKAKHGMPPQVIDLTKIH